MTIAGELQKEMNIRGKMGEPFAFLIDFEMKNPMLFPLNNKNKNIWWQFENSNNSHHHFSYNKSVIRKWITNPVSFEHYEQGFLIVKKHILNGDTYLLNYTQPTEIETNLSLKEIFEISSAPYKVYLENHFVCFSPECFVKIQNGRIFSFPMKGTIEADVANSDIEIMKDSKELAEHNTIVDLIRNDLSLVSEDVKVDEFRYLSHIKTNNRNLWQVSSQISGRLSENWKEKVGDIIFKLLPAGSISGAPKKKTLEIIKKAENYDRGYYTGIFGTFDGNNLDSCVLIRFIENQNGKLIYKSGGGITHLSDVKKEYDELLKKVYVPIA